MNPYQVVKDFEKAIAEYTGSPYAVAVDSCTNALFLACVYHKVQTVSLPKKTYVSVPCSVIHAGGKISWNDEEWIGQYQLSPYPVYDSACLLAKDMYIPGMHQCISFSANKPLNIGKGGMILTDDDKAVEWYKRARYEGRNEKGIMEDTFDMLGWNMYMTPEQASRGMILLSYIASFNIRTPTYPDLSQFEIYNQ